MRLLIIKLIVNVFRILGSFWLWVLRLYVVVVVNRKIVVVSEKNGFSGGVSSSCVNKVVINVRGVSVICGRLVLFFYVSVSMVIVKII